MATRLEQYRQDEQYSDIVKRYMEARRGNKYYVEIDIPGPNHEGFRLQGFIGNLSYAWFGQGTVNIPLEAHPDNEIVSAIATHNVQPPCSRASQ